MKYSSETYRLHTHTEVSTYGNRNDKNEGNYSNIKLFVFLENCMHYTKISFGQGVHE